MTPTVKPIETLYAGYRFRSRLEARWAVFLDAMCARWEYEREGFGAEGGSRYLPDFWIESESPHSMILEIKPPHRPLTPRETATCQAARSITPYAYVAQGDPFECQILTWSDHLKAVVHLPTKRASGCHELAGLALGLPWVLAAMAAKDEDWLSFTTAAALAARRARFEHGENQRQRGFQGVHNFIDLFTQ